tara:strand:- start:1522 stop:1884 length:363 start_codon:yes stop_codon:yes gene_type:complete
LRQKRGNCGGPFKEGLPLSEVDEEGRFIYGYRVAPNCGEGYSDLKVRSCPVASMNKMASIITAFNRHQSGLIRLTETFPNPSCAILECFDILNTNTMEMQHRSHEQQMKEFHHGRESNRN